MKHAFRSPLSWIFTLAIAAMALVPFAAFADNLQDSFESSTNFATTTAGGSGVQVGFRLVANANTSSIGGCDIGTNVDSSKAVLSWPVLPPGISVSPSSITLETCGSTQSVTFSAASTVAAGDYQILDAQIAGTDINGKPLNFNNQSEFLLRVNAATPVQQNQATLVLLAPANGTYGQSYELSTTGGSGTGAVTYDAGTSTACSVSGNTLAITSGVGTCAVQATKAADANFFSATSSVTNVAVQKATVTVTAEAKSKVYGEADPALTYTHTPALLGGNSFSGALVRVAGENAGSYAITQGTLSAGDNYTISFTSASFTIEKKAASVTPNAASKTYGAADPALTGTLTGFLAADNVTASYSRTSGETAGDYTISAELAPAGVLSNYAITYNTADFTIDKKAASVTPNAASKFYGDADPTLTGALTGFLAADNVTATYSRAAGEAVGSYAISASLAPAGVLSNYAITYNPASFTINRWSLSGFYQPVDMNGVLNTVKAGSTVPMKFEVFKGATELTATSAIKSTTAKVINCSTTAAIDDIELTTTGATSLRYDATAGQFIYNWQTPKAAGACYQVTVTTIDESTIVAFFKLK